MSDYRGEPRRRAAGTAQTQRRSAQRRTTPPSTAARPRAISGTGRGAASSTQRRSTSASGARHTSSSASARKSAPVSTQRKATSPARKPVSTRKAPPKKPRRSAFPVVMGVIFVVLIVGAIYLTRKDEFSLRVVQVTGNVSYSTDEITQMAGLQLGDDIYAVSQDKVSRALAQHDIKLEDMQVDYPGTVRLTISERQSVAAVNCAGVILIIDAEGQIMERSTSVPEGSVVLVSGMDVAVSAQGSKIESAKSWQMADMTAVLAELKARGMISTIAELNVADRYNLYLVSRTGIKIILGDDELMDDKLAWAQTVLAELTSDGVKTGVLDVSTGKNAVYADR